LLEPVKDAGEVTDVIKGLYDIRAIYDEVDETMTDEQLDEMAVRIETLRNSIV